MKKSLLLILVVFALGLFSTAYAQSAADYTYATATDGSLYDMSSGTQDAYNTGVGSDSGVSSVLNIGFTFIYFGSSYTQFSVSANGLMRLGETVISGTSYAPVAGQAIIAPLSGDNYLLSTGKIHYRVTGTEGSRKLIVEWVDLRTPYGTTGTGSKCQAVLYETTGKVEFVYGTMYMNSAASRSVFISYSTGTAGNIGEVRTIITTPSFVTTGTSLTNTAFPLGDMTNLNSTSDGSRRVFTFTPNMTPVATLILPANAATGVYTYPTLSWSGTWGPTGYKLYLGTDGGGTVTPTSVYNGTDLGAVTSKTLTAALNTSTLYYWRIVPYTGSARTDGTPSAIRSFTTTAATALTGFKTIAVLGTPDYTTFTAAINALNTGGVGFGGVIFNVNAGDTFTENTPAITASGTSASQIVFQKDGTGNNPLVRSASSVGTTDAVIRVNAGDYITFDGIDVHHNSQAIEYGYYFVGAAGDGCKNNTVKNSTVTIQSATTGSKGIYMTSAATSAAGTNDYNKFYNVNVNGALYAYHIVGMSTTYLDLVNEIGIDGGTSTITNVKGYGVYMSYQGGGKVFNQTITPVAGATYYGVYQNYGYCDIYNNIINGAAQTSTYSNYGIYLTAGTGTNNVYGNTVQSFSHSYVSTSYYNYGLYLNSGVLNNVYDNTVTGLTATGTSTVPCVGVYINGGTQNNVYRNTISNITSATGTTATAGIGGIYAYGAAADVYRNKVYNIAMNGTAGANYVYGIRVYTGTVNVNNNLIYDIKAPAATSAATTGPTAMGIRLDGGTAGNIYYNTVFLNAAVTTGTTVNTAAIYATTSPTTVNLKNNVFVNKSGTGTSGKAVAFWKSTNAYTNIVSAERNIYYVDNASASRLIFFDHTNSDQTLAAYQARVTPRDAISWSEDVPFVSNSRTIDVHLATGTPTYAEGAAIPIVGITYDWDGQTRSTTGPDIGGDEESATPINVAPKFTTLVAPADSSITVPEDATLNWNFAYGAMDFGIATGYKLYLGETTGNYNLVNGTNLGNVLTYTYGSIWEAGQDYFWKIVPTNAAGDAADAPEWRFRGLLEPMAGTYTINAGGSGETNYTTFTAAIVDLNLRGVGTGGATFNVTGNFTEVIPAITASGTASDQIVFQTAARLNSILYAGVGTGAADAILTFNGCDYVTFDGIDLMEAAGNTTAITKAEYGLYVRNATATNGATHNTFKNGKISLDRNSGNYPYAIYQNVAVTPTNDTGANSYNKYQYVTVENVHRGIYLNANATYNDTDVEISNCTIGAATANDIGNTAAGGYVYGAYASYQKNLVVKKNEVRNVSSNYTGADVYGISLASLTGNAEIYNNYIHDINFLPTTVSSWWNIGLFVQLHTSGTNTAKIYNNMIYDLVNNFSGTATNTAFGPAGIKLGTASTASTYYVDFNSVRIVGPVNENSYCLYNESTTANKVYVRNNVFANNTPAQTVAYHACWYTPTVGAIGFTGSVSDRNVLYVGNAGNGYIGQSSTTRYSTIQDWRAAVSQDTNSLTSDPIFVTSPDLHIQFGTATPVESRASYFSGAITWVTKDIDDEDRTLETRTAPDIGADTGAFTYQADCATPSNQPATFTSLIPGGTTISAVFSASDAEKYLVIRSLAAHDTTPTDGVIYTTGTIGNGTIVQASALTSFTAAGLTSSTLYYLTVYAYNETGFGGPKYLVTSPLTDTLTTLPDPPANPSPFTATGISLTEVEFSATSANPIMVAWNTTDTFGTPLSTDTYDVDDTIPGGGTVLYIGADSLLANHTGLDGDTNYYYKAWAYTVYGIYNVYSPGVARTATTLKPDNPIAFTATVFSASQIDLAATENTASDEIMVAWNTSNTFGTPLKTETYAADSLIVGGGTVLYVGPASGLVNHTGLTGWTTYYYKAWSYRTTNLVKAYSTGITDNDRTLADVVPISALPYSTSFEAATLPTGWYAENYNADTDAWAPYSSTTYAHTGSYAARMYTSSNTSNNDWMITPPFEVDGLQKVSFWVRNYTTYAEELAVKMSTTDTDSSSFTVTLMPSTPITGATYTKYDLDLWGYSGNCYFAFIRQLAPAAGYYLFVDDFEVNPVSPVPLAPTLPSPVSGAINQILFSNLSWTNNGRVSDVDLYFSSDSTAVATLNVSALYAQLTSAPLNSYDLPELDAETHYFWRVVCYNDVDSLFVGSMWDFTTMVDPSVPQPFVESFDGTYPWPGWTKYSGQLLNPSTLTSTTSGWTQDEFLNITSNPDKAAKMNLYSTYKYWLVTPMVNLGADSKVMVELGLTDYAAYRAPDNYTGVDDRFIVLVGDGTSWTPANIVREWNNSGSAYVYDNIPWETGETSIIPLTGITGRRYIAFYGESTVSNVDNDFYVNNVKVYTGEYDDYAISNFAITPLYNFVGSPMTYSFDITNNGEVTSGKVVSLQVATVEVDTVEVGTLALGASQHYIREYIPTIAGTADVVAELPADDLTSNDADTLLAINVYNTGWLAEGFEDTFPPSRWLKWGVPYWQQAASGYYDGAFAASVTLLSDSPGSRLGTPKLDIVTGDSLFFYAKSSVADMQIQLETNDNADTTAIWTDFGTPITLTTSYVRYAVDLGTAFNGQQIRFAFVALPNSIPGTIYLDKVLGPIIYIPNEVPGPVVMVGPADRAININPKTVVLDWDIPLSGGDVEEYAVYVSSVDDTTFVDTYVLQESVFPPDTEYQPYPAYTLDYDTEYYWAVVPINGIGNPWLYQVARYKFTTQPVPLGGDWTINPNLPDSTGNNFSSFTSCINYMNAFGIETGGVTITVYDTTYVEAIPVITMSGTEDDPIVFVAASGARTKPVIMPTAGVGSTDAILKFNGCDYITFDGFDIKENPANTTADTRMEYGIHVYNNGTANGATHNTIINCDITLSGVSGTRGVNQMATGLTADTGANSYNHYYGNNLTSCWYGYYLYGSSTAAYYDQFTEVGTVDTISVSITGGVYGVYYAYQGNLSISRQDIVLLGGATTSAHYGIYSNLGNNIVSIADNDITLAAPFTASYSIYPIYLSGNYSASIHGNQIHDISSTYTSGIFYGIYVSSGSAKMINEIYENDIYNINNNYTAYGIYVAATSTNNVYDNNIYDFTKSGTASGTAYLLYLTSGTNNAYNNNIYDITWGNSSLYGYYLTGGNTSLHDNTLTNIVNTSTIYSLYASGSGTNTMYNNVFSAISTTSAVYGMYVSAGTNTMYSNAINTLSTTSTSAIYGMYITGGTNTIYLNTISGLTNTTSTGAIYGMYYNGGVLQKVYKNVITGISGKGIIYGFYDISAAANVFYVYNNKIYNLEYTGTSTSILVGLSLGYSTDTSFIYNNMIWDLRSPGGTLANTAPQVTGLKVNAGGTNRIYNNTVYLNAQGTSANFCTAAFYLYAGTSSNFINNIFVNKSVPGATGRAVAFWKGGTVGSFTNVADSTNKNVYYAGTPDATHLIYYDASNPKQTIDDYKALIATKDQLSVTEDVPFASTSRVIDVHIATDIQTIVESNGIALSLVTRDIDDSLRYGQIGYSGTGTAIDIGADEGEFISLPDVETPDAQPTNLAMLPASVSVSGTFDVSDADSYLVVRHTTTTLGATPVDQKNYAIGDTLGANGIVGSKVPNGAFTVSGLTASTQYYFSIFAFNSYGKNGPKYLTTIAPLTGTMTTLPAPPADPAAFTATASSISQINLTATENPSGNLIMVAYNTTNVFGTPQVDVNYATNPDITGGGTAIYLGEAASLTNHTGLDEAKTYYYKAWSYASSGIYKVYSTGIAKDATTFTTLPYFQNFDGGTASSTWWPDGWGKLGTLGSVYTSSSTSYRYSLPNGVYIYSSAITNQATVKLPIVTTTVGSVVNVRFMGKAISTAGGIIQLGYLTDPADAATFQLIQQVPMASTTMTAYTLIDTTHVNPMYYALRHSGSPTNSCAFDDVLIYTGVFDDYAVSNLAVTPLYVYAGTPATISFRATNNGEVTSGKKAYLMIDTAVVDSLELGTVTQGTFTDKSFSYTFSSAGAYDISVYVPSDVIINNDAAELLDLPVYTAGILAEGFEDSFAPSRWLKWGHTSYNKWVQGTTPADAGVKDAQLVLGSVDNIYAHLATPLLQISSGDTLKFMAKATTAGRQIQLKYAAGTDTTTASWNNLGSPISLTTTYTQYAVDLSSLAARGIYRVAFNGLPNGAVGTIDLDKVIGPLKYVPNEAPGPVALVTPIDDAVNVNPETVVFDWDEPLYGGLADSFRVYISDNPGDITGQHLFVVPADTTFYQPWTVSGSSGGSGTFEGSEEGWIPTSSGWDATGDWEWTNTYNVANYVYGPDTQLPPTSAHSGTGMWGTVIYGPYTNVPVSGDRSYLRKTFDFTGVTNPVLDFWHYMDGYNTWDYGQILVNGTVVWGSSADAVFMPWQELNIPLTAYANNPSVQISFEWSATTVVAYSGWYIDDVYVGPSLGRSAPNMSSIRDMMRAEDLLLDYNTEWNWLVQPFNTYDSTPLGSCTTRSFTTMKQLQVTVDTLKLGSVLPGQQKTGIINVTNASPLAALSFNAVGTDFSFGSRSTLAADSTWAMPYTFTAPVTLGAYNGAITLTETDPGSSVTGIVVTADVTQTLEYGTGTNVTLDLPVDPYYGYNYSQTIYPASLLNIPAQQIDKLYYHWKGAIAAPNTKHFIVYMGHDTLSAFPSSGATWKPVSQMTQVYADSLDLLAVDEWIEFNLSTPFVYNGTSNLVIAVDENKPNYDGLSGDASFYCTPTTGSYMSIRYINDSTNPDPANPTITPTSIAGYPNIRLTLSDPPPPEFAITPSTVWDYGDVIQYSTSEKQFSVYNAGYGPFQVLSITKSGADADEFTINATGLPATVSSTPYNFTVSVTPLTMTAKSCTLHVEDSFTRTTHDILLTATGVQEPLGVPVNMAAVVSNNNNVALSWQVSEGLNNPPWIHWDSGSVSMMLKATESAPFSAAAKFTTTDLARFTSWNISKVKFYALNYDSTAFKVRIWKGSDGNASPDTMIVDQTVATYTQGGWNEITLNTPVTITGSDALWIGYYVAYTTTSYGAAMDAGPRIIGRGLFHNMGGTWVEYGGNYNLNVQAYVEEAPARSVHNTRLLSIPVINNPISRNYADLVMEKAIDGVRNTRALQGFNLWRDDVQLNTSLITAYNYQDYEVADGPHEYYVKAVYTTGTSDPSNIASVNISAPAGWTLPFAENWSTGTFATNYWYSPSTNWQASASYGNPAPAAIFASSPIKANYSNSLISWQIDATSNANLKLLYDVSLTNTSTATLEQLSVEVYDGATWNLVDNLTNAGGNIGVTTKSFDISSLVGNSIFKVRFRAHGVNSANIVRWMVDNIKVEAIVIPDAPVVTISTVAGDIVLDWDDVDGATGYKVYASDDTEAAFPSGWNLIDSPAASTYTYVVGATEYKFFRVVAVGAARANPLVTPVLTPARAIRDNKINR